MSIKILSCHPIFSENAIMISQRFNIQIEQTFNPQKGDLYIAFGSHEQAVALYLTQQQMNNEFGYIIYNSEQFDSIHWRNKYYIELCRNNPVFHYSIELAREIKDKFKIVPYSYFFFDYMVWDQKSIEEHEQYDIVFIGARSEKRENLEKQLKEEHPDKKILFHYDYEYNTPQKITSLLMNTSILLNIPYYENGVLETHRINKALSCGCKVVSMYSRDEDANEFYKDYVYFTNNIPKLLQSELDEPKKNWQTFNVEAGAKLHQDNLYVIKQVFEKLKARLETIKK
jgi:hypothetical protein